MKTIQVDGTIERHERGVFVVTLDDNEGHNAFCKPSGRMRKSNITLVAGDKVKVELSPYDLSRGRIIWRI